MSKRGRREPRAGRSQGRTAGAKQPANRHYIKRKGPHTKRSGKH